MQLVTMSRTLLGISCHLGVGLLLLGLGACVPTGVDDGNDNVNDNSGDNGNDNSGDNTNDNTGDNQNDNDSVAGLPLTTFRTESFAGSRNCGACHGRLTDSAGIDVSIDTDWRSTMMANAARDPFFLATVSSEVERAPALKEIIEDTCATCHMPMAYTQAVVAGSPTLMLDDGFLDPNNPLHEAAMDGVSCTLCHQIDDSFLDDPEASFDGKYSIDTSTIPPNGIVYGPFPEPQVPNVMESAVGYRPVFGEHIGESGLCATCHTLFTPTLDAAGEIVGTFPEQTPFQEWQHSEFGDGVDEDRSCQDCHMPTADGAVAITSVPTGLETRTPFSRHHFVGGNVFMLKMLRDNIDELGLTASTENFNATIARTEGLLSTETADLSIIDGQIDGGLLTLTVEVASKVGHKFPTSFPSRLAWIHLVVADGTGQIIFESGAPQADGCVAGDDASEDASVFEPHYDVITSDDQVQIYQSIMQNSDGEVTYTLLRAAEYAKNNRLLPRGFDKTTADEDVAVRGAAVDDDNFVGGSDRVTYEVAVVGGGPVTVTARVLYQSISCRFAADVRSDNTALIAQFGDLYDSTDKTPALVATVELTIP